MTNTYFGAPAAALFFVCGVAAAQQVTISKDSALFSSPSADAAPVAQLKQGSTGEVIGRQAMWVNVKTPSGTGWMYSFNVTYPSGGGPAPAGAAAKRSNVTATAGIRGLENQQLKDAQFDGKELDALDGFAGGADADKKRKK